jgi:regulatory protein
MLARRELSELQVRERLGRRGFESTAIDDAVARLRAQRAIDDARVAETIARTESSLRHRGKQRVLSQIERAGIGRHVAERAVDEAFAAGDDDATLEMAIDKRLKGRPIADDREFARLYRYLLNQGFDGERIVRALEARRRA